MPPIEVWAGPECTVARIGNGYVDQVVLSGHQDRFDDLDAIARLGIKAIRYPVLWERVAPNGLEQADWRWTDQRLHRLRELDIRPIVGLLHHGSGPRGTHLDDPGFPAKLAAFAKRVAERYPWVDDYTPVNEPLTTARFSGLYGHWYPHARDDRSFLRMLLNQVAATAQAMRAIRSVNPRARLIQTEDLGKVFATQHLAYQAAFENERRWLALDLLIGRVDATHPLYAHLRSQGVEAEVLAVQEEPCPPDIVGVNHYLTSERFLDERLDRYSAWTHGGNGIDRYADVEAVRVLADGPAGVETLLLEAWERYRRPIAVTEVHNGSTREEQIRWFKEVWDAANAVRARGADIRAVTAWSLFGSFDWNSLLTRRDGFYESGVFDLRAPRPRPTALARMITNLARGGNGDHPVLDIPGWWRRDDRFAWPPVMGVLPKDPRRGPSIRIGRPPARPVLIVGATGTLGQAFARHCVLRGLPHRLVGRPEVDLADTVSVRAVLDRYRPWAIVNAAGFVRVDEAELHVEPCRRANVAGPAILAEACGDRGIAFVTFSSDLVFDGTKTEPYVENDAVAPLNVYGASKAEAETAVLDILPEALVIRTSAFFGPWDAHNFVTRALSRLRDGRPVPAAGDIHVSPTYVPDLVDACLDLLIDGERGVWHLASVGAVTWADLALMAARRAGLDGALVEPASATTLGWVACRPRYSVLGSRRGGLMAELDNALARYVRACAVLSDTRTGRPT